MLYERPSFSICVAQRNTPLKQCRQNTLYGITLTAGIYGSILEYESKDMLTAHIPAEKLKKKPLSQRHGGWLSLRTLSKEEIIVKSWEKLKKRFSLSSEDARVWGSEEVSNRDLPEESQRARARGREHCPLAVKLPYEIGSSITLLIVLALSQIFQISLSLPHFNLMTSGSVSI